MIEMDIEVHLVVQGVAVQNMQQQLKSATLFELRHTCIKNCPGRGGFLTMVPFSNVNPIKNSFIVCYEYIHIDLLQ